MNLIPTEHWEYGIVDLIHETSKILNIYSHDEIFLPGIGTCFTIGSGRSGLVVAIKTLNLKPGSHIGVPLFCCPVVLKAIELADCKPRFIDIEKNTFCISAEDLAKKINQVDAVIALHMFGNISDIKSLRVIANNKPIIEDCAQALGSRINDCIAGTFGDIAFFSFRSGKYLSVGEGGAVFSNNDKFRDKIKDYIKSLENRTCMSEISHIFKTYIRSQLRSKPLYGLVGHRLWTFYNRITDYSEKASMSINKIYKSDHSIAVKRLKSINVAIAKQRENARFYEENLNLEEGMICKEKYETYYNRYLYPILFNSPEQREFMSFYLHKKGIGTIKPYHDIQFIAAKYYGYIGDCPVSEKIAERVLLIPNHYKLKKQEIQYIARSLNKGWGIALKQ